MRIKSAERILLSSGLILLALWMAARFQGAIGSRAAVMRFETDNPVSSGSGDTVAELISHSPVDFRLWNPKRVSAYEESLTQKTDAPLAILRVPKISLEVPVFNDTDDLTLNHGVGRILGTAQVGRSGNLGIAGHRDGFFRGLQSIVAGDELELVRPRRQVDLYTVTQIQIVTPEDTSVLNPTPVPTLTLVTCFPFYFIGHAPKRYIVTAVLKNARTSGFRVEGDTISTGKGQQK